MNGLNKYHTGNYEQKNNEIMNMQTDLGTNSDYVKKLLGWKHNHATTWYYLLMKKLKKEQFPDIAEGTRTLKKKVMDKHPQKYADQSNDKILSYYGRKTDHENRNGSAKEIISQSNLIASNDDLNSSLKKENSNDSLSPIKIDEKEVSRRMNSDKRDSIRKPNSIRATTQYRKASNDSNNIELLNENQNLNKKTLQQKCRKDSQETYQPNLDHIRLSNNEWNGDIQ